VAAGRRGQVLGISAGKTELSARRRKLKKVPLLPAEINAELERMLVPDPGHSVRHLKNVFESMFGRPERVAERSKAGDIDKRQSRSDKVATIFVGYYNFL